MAAAQAVAHIEALFTRDLQRRTLFLRAKIRRIRNGVNCVHRVHEGDAPPAHALEVGEAFLVLRLALLPVLPLGAPDGAALRRVHRVALVRRVAVAAAAGELHLAVPHRKERSARRLAIHSLPDYKSRNSTHVLSLLYFRSLLLSAECCYDIGQSSGRAGTAERAGVDC